MSLARPHDLLLALRLLSRLPLPEQDDWSRQAQAAWAYPVVGLIIGALASMGGLLAQGAGLHPALMAVVTLTMLIILTGAMHEDGLADCADGFWGGFDRERRLEIMKDSHIGSYGVIALVLSLIGRWAALWVLWDAGATVAIPSILVAASGSRAAMGVVMWALTHARTDGLSRSVGAVSRGTALLGVGLAVGLALVLPGISLFWPLLFGTIIAWGCAVLARAKISGQTGDVLGATQQMAEIAILLSLLP